MYMLVCHFCFCCSSLFHQKKCSGFLVLLYKAVVGFLVVASLKACQCSKTVLSLACNHIKELEIDLNVH